MGTEGGLKSVFFLPWFNGLIKGKTCRESLFFPVKCRVSCKFPLMTCLRCVLGGSGWYSSDIVFFVQGVVG